MYIINGVIYADLPSGAAPQIINGVIYNIEEEAGGGLTATITGTLSFANGIITRNTIFKRTLEGAI